MISYSSDFLPLGIRVEKEKSGFLKAELTTPAKAFHPFMICIYTTAHRYS